MKIVGRILPIKYRPHHYFHHKKLFEIFKEEKYNFILWLPIIFIAGSIFRFDFVDNFNLYFLNKLFLIICIIFLIFNFLAKNVLLKIFSIFIVFFSLGYIRTNFIVTKYNYPIIKEPLGKTKIFGTIEQENIKINKRGITTKDLVVVVDKIEPFYKNVPFRENIEIPKKLQLRLSDSKKEINLNEAVLSCYLFPLDNKRLPSSFNEKRYYYFKKIGGLGYKCEIIFNRKIDNKLTIKQKIDKLRFKIAEKVIAVRPESKSTGIMAILLTGQKNLADKQAIENMNFSGLAHLLSISGLHMMILIGFVMFISKWILLRCENIALKYNVFKISAFISLIINFLYLLISGANISAVRAYLMSVILLTSIIIGRFNTSIRSVMFTMFLLVFLKPYIIYTAGFQLSFSAVIIIISIMDYYSENYGVKIYRTNIMKFFEYLRLSFIISFAVECATTPFSIYNFNNYSFYNILVNSFVTPLVTFFVLPLCIISLFLMPLNLEFLPLLPASYATDFVLWVSKCLVNLPHSVMFIKSPNNFSLFCMIFGLLWWCLWKSKLRKLGIYLYIIGFVMLCFQKIPDVIIDNRDDMILFFDKNFYVLNSNKYEINAIIRKFGRNDFFDLEKTKHCENKSCIVFDKNVVFFYKNGKYVRILKDKYDYYIENKSKNMKILYIN